jgi:hypothetical protein
MRYSKRRSSAHQMTEYTMNSHETLPIACLLGTNDFQERTRWIRELTSRHLRAAERRALSIQLTYAPEPAQVRKLVSREQTCCAFLRFELQEDAEAVYLTITAAERARGAVDALFAQFAPEPVSGSTFPDTVKGA